MSNSKSTMDWTELLETSRLPSPEDSLFTSQEDRWNNACLNWCHDGWGIYATGYKEAADILVKRVEECDRGHDTLVYPILFLYRQYLELEIKNLIRQARRLQDIEGDFPKHHHIAKLWEACHQLILQISPGDSVNELKEIARLIDEFAVVDPTSMAFRYPEDKEGKPSLPGISHINLRNVREVIAKIAIILMGANSQIAEYLQYKHEMERELPNEW